jgi:uncharacterized RDD family membrane protein YckC/tRNA A-37 threonylcarbamoyl transferase component Bud32
MSVDPVALEATLLADSGRPVSGPRTASQVDPAEAERWTGVELDHFSIQKVIGLGGMGAVFLARDNSLDRPVAIKILPSGGAEMEERFIREARAQAILSSPHVVPIYFIGRAPPERGGALFFAMEWVDGEPLEARLDRKVRMSGEEARRAMIQVARGLRDAARAGIVHRDIKPSNLLVSRQGTIKIADFGVAKPLSGSSSMTHDGMVVGTPLYMAPEQARGEKVDARADMYALGCTFFHMIKGEPPFDGPTPLATVAKHLTQPPPKLIDPTVSPALCAIVERLLAKEAKDRFADYDALIAALEAAAPTAIHYAGFWARGAAAGIDLAIAGGLLGLIGWPAMVLQILYTTAMHAWRGQTLGKILLRLEVRRLGGERLTIARSFARTIVALWLPAALGIVVFITRGRMGLKNVIEHLQGAELEELQSFLMAFAVSHVLASALYVTGLALAAFHPQKRAAHDLVAGSEVVYRMPGAS